MHTPMAKCLIIEKGLTVPFLRQDGSNYILVKEMNEFE